MTKPKPEIKIVDVATGEVIVRDANAEEISQMELDAANAAAAKTKAEAREAQRQAILDRLGLTEEEAKLLLG